MRIYLLFIVFVVLSACKTNQSANNATPQSEWQKTIAEKEKFAGYFNYYWDEKSGKILLEIDKLNTEFLYVNYLSAGIGSNDIGLDRGQIGNSRIVTFKKIGNKIFLFQPNYDYRASTENEAERKSITDAFSHSILFSFDIVAQQDWSVLVDATDFFLRDAHRVSNRLKSQKEGSYQFNKANSAFHLEGSGNFQQNTELDFWISFAGEPIGREIRSVTPDPQNITVRQHHSFVELPDDDFEPREFDVRAGYFGTGFKDYSVPITEDINQRYINRHRLQKANPGKEKSKAVEPIIYYLDPGTPEPVRSALLDGARWWNEAFEAAGFIDGFQVEMLPEGADPLDIRYNVIQWVHRSTRGWSYGASVVDPRTGEIIKGHVSLGSLRVRQDYLIATGLLAAFKENDSDPRMEEMALARLRQLSAHEIGHTIGLAHNYIASTNEDASVMDYPHPKIAIDDKGNIDLSNAYTSGIGSWDKIAIRYGYEQFPEEVNEDKALEKILEEATEAGLRFISDRDARTTGGAHPYAHLWDNGKDAVVELNRLIDIRSKAFEKMDASVIRKGEPMAKIQDVLIPVYFLHRYQVEAAVKLIGGIDYSYKVKGDAQKEMQIVAPQWQMEAVNSLLNAVSPETLALPEKLLKEIHPRPLSYYDNRELLKGRTGVTFDAIGASEQAATMVFELLLHPERMARLIEFNSRDSKNPGVKEVLNTVFDALFKSRQQSGYQGAIQMTVQHAYVMQLIKSMQNANNSPLVQAELMAQLKNIQSFAGQRGFGSLAGRQVHADYLQSQINLFLEQPMDYKVKESRDLPPGSPIGSFCD
ncbi:zinc-dependent metalloprotease [Marivirga aurantiaca]|nr:zinc-dependent metalloprotease [Marivirga aurantiaca]